MAKSLFRDDVQDQRPTDEPSKWITLGLPGFGLAIVIIGGLVLASIVSSGGGHGKRDLSVHPIGVTGSSSGAPSASASASLPKPGFDLPPDATVCPSGGTGPYDVVAISGPTTCDFGSAVHDAYTSSPITSSGTRVTDPTTHKWFTTRCTPGKPVVCKIISGAQILLGAAA